MGSEEVLEGLNRAVSKDNSVEFSKLFSRQQITLHLGNASMFWCWTVRFATICGGYSRSLGPLPFCNCYGIKKHNSERKNVIMKPSALPIDQSVDV